MDTIPPLPPAPSTPSSLPPNTAPPVSPPLETPRLQQNNRKKIIALLSLVLILGIGAAIATTIYLTQKPKDTRTKAAPTTNLSISPDSGSYQVGQTFQINLIIDTGSDNNQIQNGDIYINFDPQYITATLVEKGAFLTNNNAIEQNKDIDNTLGRITYVFNFAPGNAQTAANQTLLRISFQAVAAGTASVSINNQSILFGVTEQDNVLSGTIPASFTITNASATNTPTTVATSTPTTDNSDNDNFEDDDFGDDSNSNDDTPAPTNTPTPAILPEAGLSLPSALIFIGGILLTILGALFLF